VGAPLEAPFAAGAGPVASAARIAQFAGEVARVGGVKAARAATVGALCGEIAALWGELSSRPAAGGADAELDALVAAYCAEGEPAPALAGAAARALGWTPATLAALEARQRALQAEKAAREERIMVIGQQITALWKRLATTEAEQTSFLESHAGIGDEVIAACEAYLAQKKAEFEARLVDLVAGARAGIAALWDELRLGPAQRASAFPAFSTLQAELTDDVYAAHEEYAAALQSQVDEAKPILRAIEKRAAILAEKDEYEALMADPQRLLAKGSSSARLREEKLERRVKKELPAVTKKLRAQVVEWEDKHGGQPLTIDGARFLLQLDSEEAAEAKAREDARAHRHKPAEDEAAGAAPGAGEKRSTSAPTRAAGALAKTASVATLASAAPPAPPASKTSKPAGMKKPSVPASSVAPAAAAAADDDGHSTFSAAENFVAATARAGPKAGGALAVSAAAPNAAAAPRTASSASLLKTAEASVSAEARDAAQQMLSSL